MADSEVFSTVQIHEKNIEPSQDNNQQLNRNFQLGYSTVPIFNAQKLMVRTMNDWDNFPVRYGGFISRILAREQLNVLETELVLSGNLNGFVRTSNQKQITEATVKQTTNTGGLFSNLFTKNE